MSAVSILCFLIAGVVLISAMRRGADAFSPGRAFLFVWSIAIGLSDLKLSALQYDWTFTTWIQLLLGPLSLLAGLFIAYVLHMNAPVLPLELVRVRWRANRVDTGRLFASVCTLFALYSVAYLGTYLVKGFIPLFSPLGGMRRAEFTVFGFGLFVESIPVILFFTTLYLLLARGQTFRKFILIAISAISAVTFLFLAQRYQLMMGGLICIGLLYYTTRLVGATTAIVGLACTVLFFYWASSLRAGQLYINFLYMHSKMRFSSQYAFFTEPYMYIVMNLENFAHAIEVNDRFTFGLYTFDFVGAFTGLKHWTREYFSLVDRPYLSSGYNTFTAFWTYYRDFGIIGVTAIPLGIGFFAGTIYHSMRVNPTLRMITSYAIVLFVLVISFFNSVTSDLWFIWVLLVITLVFRVIGDDKAHTQSPTASSS